MSPTTLYEKIFAAHTIAKREDGVTLLRIDRHYLHEGSFHAFGKLARSGRSVARPQMTAAFADHYMPTGPQTPHDPEISAMQRLLADNAARHGIALYGPDDAGHGIVHVAAPELGLTLPGMTVVCGDSHTSTHGAFGALGFGIGASEVEHVLATQTLWQRPSKTLHVEVAGELAEGVTAKDVILALIAKLGAGGGSGHVVEYAGPAIEALSMEGRMTICNMSIEAGARAGLIAPDETTFKWLAERPGGLPAGALGRWSQLSSDEGARFDREVTLDGSALAPMVTWGTSPETALPIGSAVPDERADDLSYMGLEPGTPLDGLAVDTVFIGSCTNGRIEDLRAVAGILRGQRVAVPTIIVPGSAAVRRAAEREGIADVFADAGAEFRPNAGCSMCAALNGDRVVSGARCASTTNRNFRGRQGPGARTHLMSPPMAAAAAVIGAITDVRRLSP